MSVVGNPVRIEQGFEAKCDNRRNAGSSAFFLMYHSKFLGCTWTFVTSSGLLRLNLDFKLLIFRSICKPRSNACAVKEPAQEWDAVRDDKRTRALKTNKGKALIPLD
jgi:hypothetical protein